MTSPLRFVTKLPALLLALFFLAPAVPAHAAPPSTVQIVASDPAPAAGSPITFSVPQSFDCTDTYTFTIDGKPQPPQAAGSITTTFSTTGNHTVTVTIDACRPDEGEGSLTVSVGAGVSGTINVTPDPPRPGEPAKLSVTASGGLGEPYVDFKWSVDGVVDPAATKRTYTRALTAGSHTVTVTFSDSGDSSTGNPPHSGSATRTITAEIPPTPTPAPPTPTPAPGETPAPAPPVTPAPTPVPLPTCSQKIDFALSEFTTDGCFGKVGSNPDRWTTTDQVSLNGVAFADSGRLFTITGPTADEPGGHIKTDNSAIQLDRFIPFSGNVDWTLPAGKQGEEGALREVAVPAFARLFKLRIAGSISIKLGYSSTGRHYAAFPLNVELPPAFTAGPSKFAGGVSGAASISVDAAGIHYDGLKVAVTDVWVGRLKVASACFSYVPAGGQAVAPCDAPELDGKPYITCATDVNTDRFDGSAVIELPTASSTRLAAFGGLANGEVSKLGGYVDGLGTTVPIVPGVFLNRVGFGLCLTPPPLKLRGDVGVTALGGKLDVNGHVTYTDATDSSPWAVEVGGNVKFNGTQLGDATVGFNAWGDVNFDVNAGIDLAGVASINGNVNGWIEPRNNTFNIAGSVQGCITDLTCATASGLVSSTGIAGCLDLGSFTVDVPSDAKQGPFGFGSISFTTRKETVYLRGGVGYRWGGSVSLLGNSCDFSPYAATRSASGARVASAARLAGGALTESIAPGTRALSLRVHGTNGPPKIVVSGPGGATITSPATGSAAQEKDRYVLAENPSDGTTSVLLINPAAGDWTVAAVPGAASAPTTMDRSNLDPQTVLFGQVRKARGGSREVAVQYALPDGASLSLAEHGKGIGGTIKSSVRGKKCRGAKALPDGRSLRCAVVKFTPSRGPGGTRQIQALVTRDGLPLTTKTVATFRAPAEKLPSRPGKLRARRVGTAVVVGVPKISGASRLTATAVLTDGRELGFDLAASCRAVRIPSVPAGDAVKFKIAGVRYDLQSGKYRSVSLKANRKSAGPSGKLPKKTCS